LGEPLERPLIPPSMPSHFPPIVASSVLHLGHLAQWIFIAGVPWGVWLPYLVGFLVLAIGLISSRTEFGENRGLNKVVALGPICLAVPLAVFGTEHFTATTILAGMVPAWIPGHVFWALLVGACLIGAALSIAAKKYAWLTSALAGLMIVLFVLLIHVPGIAANPRSQLLWVVGLRDSAFAGGAFGLAASFKEGWGPQTRHWLATLARFFVAIPVAYLGVEQILHPELAPGVPLVKVTPPWVPAHSLWGYLIGAIWIVVAIFLLINKQVRPAATWLGLITLLLVLFIYLPIVIGNPADIGNALNYLADTLLLSGAALALAGAYP
jgi:hypothetical protein